jgi:hypothetical protein
MEAKIIVHPAAITAYVERAWAFSYQNLWYKYLLDDDEIEMCRSQLWKLFRSSSDENFQKEAADYFHTFCIQVLEFRSRKEVSREKLFSLMAEVISEWTEPKNLLQKEATISILETVQKTAAVE